MNDITCGIAEDLLPLYIDDCCSEESRQAIEEHMKKCKKCEEKYMCARNDLPAFTTETADIRSEKIAVAFSKKIRKRKRTISVLTVIFGLFVIIFLFFAVKALTLMSAQESKMFIDDQENTIDLSGKDFSCSAQDIKDYKFYTSSTRLIIRLDDSIDENITVRLWNINDSTENIMLGNVGKNQKTIAFTHLSDQETYSITVDNMPDINLSVSSRLTFWEAFSQALQN